MRRLWCILMLLLLVPLEEPRSLGRAPIGSGEVRISTSTLQDKGVSAYILPETVEWSPLLNASPQRGPRECPCNPYCCRTGPVLWGYRCVGGICSYCEGGYSRDWGCVPTKCGRMEPCGCEECVWI